MAIFKKLIATALAATAVLGGIVAPVSNVFADEGKSSRPAIQLTVSPVSNRVVLNAGDELTYLFTVQNDGAQDIKFKVYAVPYNVVDESYNVNFANQTNHTQISRWIQFRTSEVKKDEGDVKKEFASEATFELAAAPEGQQSKMLLEYKIAVPDDVPAGGQYAAIVTEYVPDDKSSATGVKTVPRVNMVVYGSTSGDTVNSAGITEHEMPGFLTDGNVNIKSVVKNDGNTDFSAVYEFKIEGLFGDTVYERTAAYDVLPDTSRRTDLEWKETPAFGIYRVTSTVMALDQKSEISKIVLKIPIFIIIILLILLTMLVVWIIILIKKRQAKKSRIVV